ncbi:MAG: limonene-1,2-epoxide hydrolase family protein [Candidatus Binatia bacterium]|nr:limonene-1,2-epoxide hydrolase family protein [Candidatus Binatia bacterium]
MSAAVDLFRRFCAEWPGLPPQGIAGFFAADFLYRHDSMERPLAGALAISGAVEIFRARFEQIESEVLRIAEDDGVVLSEREDRLWLPGGRIVQFRAMATVEVRDGKISLWTDYFDLVALARQVDLTEG